MKYRRATHVELGGTSYKGTIHAPYDRLVRIFGEPTESKEKDKIQAEWLLKFEDGTVAAIYDWKMEGTPLQEIREWMVGGNSAKSLFYIVAIAFKGAYRALVRSIFEGEK